MKDEEFFEFIKHDLKRIESDLIGFLEVYYPMLRSSWNPQNETDFIIGWLLGSKEQEYSSGYYDKHKVRLGKESLYRIHQEISNHKDEIKTRISADETWPCRGHVRVAPIPNSGPRHRRY